MTTAPPDWAATMDLTVRQALLQLDPTLTLPEVKAEITRLLLRQRRIWDAGTRYERKAVMEAYPEFACVCESQGSVVTQISSADRVMIVSA